MLQHSFMPCIQALRGRRDSVCFLHFQGGTHLMLGCSMIEEHLASECLYRFSVRALHSNCCRFNFIKIADCGVFHKSNCRNDSSTAHLAIVSVDLFECVFL